MNVFNEALKPNDKFVIVDEFELFSNAARMNLFHTYDVKNGAVNTYFIDSLSLFANFKTVFGFCPHIPEIMKRKVQAINSSSLFFNIGNMKAGGME